MLWIYLCMCVVIVVGQEERESLEVTIQQGSLRGYKVNGTNVFTFHGVPYATAPTGVDKFKAPLPPPTWSSTFEAVNKSIICPQPGFPNVDENCLIANIYVPETSNTDLPVLAIVHGGAFQLGRGDDFTTFSLMKERDIIVVNFNYRLGVHGFLCLGTEVAPGNAGMKDQLAFLRWLNANIRAFGGNPDDVTIAGCSAGGVSVDLLRVVNVTDGLFNRVITESGSTVGIFGVQVDPLENAREYATALGLENVQEISSLEEFYTNASLEDLVSRVDLIISRTDSSVLFLPCIERDIIGIERFLVDAPVNIIRNSSNKIMPSLYGFANMEGLLQIGYFQDWQIKMNEDFKDFIPADLKFESDEDMSAVAEEIKQFYFGEGPVTNDSIIPFIDFVSDVLFIYPMLRSVSLHRNTRNDDNFYIYEYSFINQLTQNHPGNVTGADHCEQIIAVLDEDESQLEDDYIEMKALMRKMYIDFITTGHPIAESSTLPLPWNPANADRDPHMAIGANITLGGPTYEERVKFWDQIYDKYYRTPIPPNKEERESLEVTIQQGSLRGHKANGTNVFTFYGVPYATAPTGVDKFKAPLPPPTWSSTFEAVNKFIICPQPDFSNVDENCLIANIYVPETSNTDLPVLAIVHGGAFQLGRGDDFTTFSLMKERDIIVVNFNYRLGVHGFLCLGTEVAPGNAGMKDQLAFLRWLNANIRAFGGNPDDVTIAGCSAGGVSVDLLRVVNVTDGLFNRVITESGSTVGTIAIQIDPLENAREYATALGLENVQEISSLEEFYTNASLEDLVSRVDLIISRTDSSVLFLPCIERDIIGIERFLVDAPVNIIRNSSNKIMPSLYGFANMEGLLQIGYFQDWQIKMNEDFKDFIPADLKFESDEDMSAVAEEIKQFYFGEGPVTNDSIIPFIDFVSDVLFIYPMLRSVSLHRSTRDDDNFYIYEYSFINQLTQNHPGNVTGADHCEQMIAVFDEDESQLEEDYIEMKALMRKMYIDFITTGHPIAESSTLPVPWNPANADRDPHMAIGANITLGGPTYEERAKFWDQIYDKYYRTPIPPNKVAKMIPTVFLCGSCVRCSGSRYF